MQNCRSSSKETELPSRQNPVSRRCRRYKADAVGEAVRGAPAKIDDATNLNFPPLFIFMGLKLHILLARLYSNASITARACEQLLRERLHTKTGRRECAGARHKSLLWLSQPPIAWAEQGNQRTRHSHSAITRMKFVTGHSAVVPRYPAGCEDSPIL